MESSASAPCKAGYKPGATAATRSPPRCSLSPYRRGKTIPPCA
jgi:hypothetical protein